MNTFIRQPDRRMTEIYTDMQLNILKHYHEHILTELAQHITYQLQAMEQKTYVFS